METLLIAWGIAGLFFVSLFAAMAIKNAKETRRKFRAIDPLFRLDNPVYVLESCKARLLKTDDVLKEACTIGEHRRP
jgi:hypothetical protein